MPAELISLSQSTQQAAASGQAGEQLGWRPSGPIWYWKLLLEIKHEVELERIRYISATNTIIVKSGEQSEKFRAYWKTQPYSFPYWRQSYWIALEMLVGSLLEIEFGWVFLKILTLIHCCAHCRASNSGEMWLWDFCFFCFLGVARE